MIQAGTGKRYGAQSERGQVEVWGGIVSARLEDIAEALGTAPEAVLDALEAEGIGPMLDTAEPKGRGDDRDRPTSPELRCLAFTREDFARLVEAVASEAVGDEEAAVPAEAAR
jgi:hypothetical protein